MALARELVEAALLADLIELREGDARSLPFPDASFDAVLAATVLVHVPEGERAIPEMVRVTRPGGRVGVFDLDGDSILIAHPDRALTRRIVAAASDNATVDGWLTRRLPGLLERAGLAEVRVRGFMPLERKPASFYGKGAERAAAPSPARSTGAGSTGSAPSRPPARSSAAACISSPGAGVAAAPPELPHAFRHDPPVPSSMAREGETKP